MSQPPGITVFCDPTLQPAFRWLDGLSRHELGVRVSVLSAPSALMLAQLQRGTRNDILFTSNTAMDQAAQSGLVKPETRSGGWANKIVLAGLKGQAVQPTDKAGLIALLLDSRFALTDATVAADLDGRAVLASNNLPIPNHVTGVANTQDVAFMLIDGTADLGLLYATDVAADKRLMTLAALDADPAQISYAAAVSTSASSPNAVAFLNFLREPHVQAGLRVIGLQVTGLDIAP